MSYTSTLAFCAFGFFVAAGLVAIHAGDKTTAILIMCSFMAAGLHQYAAQGPLTRMRSTVTTFLLVVAILFVLTAIAQLLGVYQMVFPPRGYL